MENSPESPAQFSIALRGEFDLLHELDEVYDSLDDAQAAAAQMQEDARGDGQDATYMIVIKARG